MKFFPKATKKNLNTPIIYDVEKGSGTTANGHLQSPNKKQQDEKRRGSFYSERLGVRFESGDGSSTANLLRWFRNLRALLEDWLFLALLGILVAVCSLAMDLTIEYLQTWHIFTYDYAYQNTKGYANYAATYFVWTAYVIILVGLSAFFVRMISPQAIGSGIPEMKTILRGVILKEYLTLRTLISKMVGLTLALGSGMPIGKEGPFVHIASVVANILSQFVHSFEGIYSNESRSYEMLAAACAVGVSSTFSAPIGGVLFSIEVTSVYFAVRNYWRGFFAATCSATLFRILRVMLNETEVTVSAFYQTRFPRDAFLPEELPAFALVGVVCGFFSAAFICFQRRCVLFLRRNNVSKIIFQKYWAIYPAFIAFLVGSFTYPEGFGRFLGGQKKFTHAAKDFFAECTWSLPQNVSLSCSPTLLDSWTRPDEYGLFTSLPCFIVTYFILSILTSTLPIPSGIFGPSFVIGGAIGRLIGEIMAVIYPEGIRGENDVQIFPGVYAIVGSAAFTGGVTHTVSVAVIVFELTGQLLYILPVMIAVLIANAICSYFQPSIYDSAIRIKHLPYLPNIPHTSSRYHGILVEQFMCRDVTFLSYSTTYRELQETLFTYPHLKAFPVVENKTSGILIGSCSRTRLLRNLNSHVGPAARQQEAMKRTRIGRKYSIDQKLNERGNQQKRISIDQQIQRTRSDTEIETMLMEQQKNNSSGCTDPGNNLGVPAAWENGQRFTVMPVETEMKKSTDCGLNTLATILIQNHSQLTPAAKRSLTIPASLSATSATYSTIGNVIRTLTRLSHRLRKNVDNENECDLRGEERNQWEKEQLDKRMDFSEIAIDPAPFQLVEQTSLVKVHSLFSLLGLNRAYVTKCGRLVGVVALRDLRQAVERVQSGELTAKQQFVVFGPPTVAEEDSKLDDENLDDDEQPPTGGSSDDDEDEQNDILNPRLVVVTQPDSMYGKTERKISTDVRNQMHKASREAFMGAVNLLTRGVIGTEKTADSSTEETSRSRLNSQDEDENDAPASENDVIAKSPPIPIFIISSSEDESRESNGDRQKQHELDEDNNNEEDDLGNMAMTNHKKESTTLPPNQLSKSPSSISISSKPRDPNRKVRVVSPSSPLPTITPSNTNLFNFEFTNQPQSDYDDRSAPAF